MGGPRLNGFWDAKQIVLPLPPNKNIVHVLSDFLRYIFGCAEEFIRHTHGEHLWLAVKDDIAFVLAHPNGWGGEQKAQMCHAAVLAGFVPDTDAGRARITFVTESEASLHFCLSNSMSLGNDDSGIVVVDAGGETIDVTAYRKRTDAKFEEASAPTCHFQGGKSVTMRAQQYFEGLLFGTRFHDDVETITTRFDKGTKHVFKNPDELYHIQFAAHREREPALNIRGGRLAVPGREIAKFFEPSITCIVNSIHAQMAASQLPIKSVWLVGGLSASTCLYERVREQIEPLGISVSRPDTHVNKAVSSGAVSFYLDSFITSRVSRFTYGSLACVAYNPNDPRHFQRAHRVVTHRVTGALVLEGKWVPILQKGIRVASQREFRERFSVSLEAGIVPHLEQVPVFVYSGESPNGAWVDEEPGLFHLLCTIEADVSNVRTEWQISSTGALYQVLSYEVVLLLGSSELKAQIAYFENGVEKRGPAKVVSGANGQ